MITPAQQKLHVLWHRPGTVMAEDWWQHLSMQAWQMPYVEHTQVRSSLDIRIAEQLGHKGAVPALTPQAEMLLKDACSAETLCVALGLWALNCPDYLLLRHYRQALLDVLSEATLTQLCALFPTAANAAPSIEPEHLVNTARDAGASWLATANDPAVAVTRLLWSPTRTNPPKASPIVVLDKLGKWI